MFQLNDVPGLADCFLPTSNKMKPTTFSRPLVAGTAPQWLAVLVYVCVLSVMSLSLLVNCALLLRPGY